MVCTADEFFDMPQGAVGRLSGEPEDGDVGIVVADGFGSLQVFNEEERRGSTEFWSDGGVVRAELNGSGEATEMDSWRTFGCSGKVQRSAEPDVGAATQAKSNQGVRAGSGVEQDLGNVASLFGVLEVGLRERAGPIVGQVVGKILCP